MLFASIPYESITYSLSENNFSLFIKERSRITLTY